ncbi:MAG TPA: hypothetical protein VKA37_11315 [Halobacteriales archaeon]|nr:hypothetical protein [Halobacteriales archaeon]
MATAFQIAMAAGLAVALVHSYFARQEGRPWRAVARTFLGWMAAFLLAGLAGPTISSWLLTHVF